MLRCRQGSNQGELEVSSDVVVVIGAGGIGQAIAERQGAGRLILLADRNQAILDAARKRLEASGHNVTTSPVDVASADSVRSLAETAEARGNVVELAHTAGLSPVQASIEAILKVDLLGVALVLEEFGAVIARGGAGVVISSMAGHMLPPLDPSQEQALARTRAQGLLALPFLDPKTVGNSGAAYGLSKRANQLRVQAAALTWGDRGARVNSISPGIILTPLALEEMAGPGAAGYQPMIERSPAGRVGTTAEVAAAAAYLLGPEARFVTGSDLLIDGGVIAALKAGRLTLATETSTTDGGG
jgi:NAD(P)-dependent dehydrogenase (short-subunit alcohol dehydrogenase family)